MSPVIAGLRPAEAAALRASPAGRLRPVRARRSPRRRRDRRRGRGRSAPRRRRGRASRRRARRTGWSAGPSTPTTPRSPFEPALQARQLLPARSRDARPFEDEHRRPEHAGADAGAGRVIALPRFARLRQAAHHRVAELEVAQSARGHQQAGDAEDRGQRRKPDRDADQAPAAPRLVGSRSLGRSSEPARPALAATAGPGRRSPAPPARSVIATSAETTTATAMLGPKALRKRTPESSRVSVAPAIISAAVGSPAAARRSSRLTASSRLGALAQPLPVAGDEEDEVVGEHAEDQGDDHRLRLARDREAVAFGDPAQDPVGAEVGDRHGRQARAGGCRASGSRRRGSPTTSSAVASSTQIRWLSAISVSARLPGRAPVTFTSGADVASRASRRRIVRPRSWDSSSLSVGSR